MEFSGALGKSGNGDVQAAAEVVAEARVAEAISLQDQNKALKVENENLKRDNAMLKSELLQTRKQMYTNMGMLSQMLLKETDEEIKKCQSPPDSTTQSLSPSTG